MSESESRGPSHVVRVTRSESEDCAARWRGRFFFSSLALKAAQALKQQIQCVPQSAHKYTIIEFVSRAASESGRLRRTGSARRSQRAGRLRAGRSVRPERTVASALRLSSGAEFTPQLYAGFFYDFSRVFLSPPKFV